MWRCSVCTFDSPLDSATCDICDTPRDELSETLTISKGSGIISIPVFESLFLCIGSQHVYHMYIHSHFVVATKDAIT